MKTVLITGAGGFCARHLVAKLRETNEFTIVGTDLAAYDPRLDSFDRYERIDIRDVVAVESLLIDAKPDLVFHLAGLTRGDARDIYAVNVGGTANLLEALKNNLPGTRILVVGSAAEYGRLDASDVSVTEEYTCKPEGPYAISKHSASTMAQDYALRGMKIVIARPYNITGAGMPSSLVLGAIIERAREALRTGIAEPSIQIGNLDTQRDFIAVEDVVDAYIQMIELDYWGEIFNICSGVPISIRRLVDAALANSSRPINLIVDPDLVRANDVPVSYGNFEKAHRLLGFEPKIGLEESLRAAWNHVMANEFTA